MNGFLQEEVKTTIREILQRNEPFEAYEQDLKSISDLPPLHSAVQVKIKSFSVCDVAYGCIFVDVVCLDPRCIKVPSLPWTENERQLITL